MMAQTEQESNTFSADTPFPFGKHKGKPLAVVMADANYVQWLEQQAWMGEKYPNIVDFFRNGPAKEDSCTPDHNAMQVRYLDEEYCNKLVSRLFPTCKAILYEALIGGEKVALRRNGCQTNWGYEVHYHLEADCEEKAIPKDVKVEERPCGEPTIGVAFNTEFEHQRWDVAFCAAPKCCPKHSPKHNFSVFIELKPSISEDYPAILRKVRERFVATRNPYDCSPMVAVVIADQYTGKSATLEQVKKMFATRDITLLLSSEFA